MGVQGIYENGINYTFEEYTKLAKDGKSVIPLTLALTLIKNAQAKHSLASPSMAGSCPRQKAIENKEDFFYDLDMMRFLVRGVLAHKLFEDSPIEGLKERRVKIDTGDYKLNGCVDLIRVKEQEIVDYKTVQKFAFDFKTGEFKEDFLWKQNYLDQINLYALACAQGGIKENEGEKIGKVQITKGSIEYYCFDVSSGKWNHSIHFPITEQSIEEARVRFNAHIKKIELCIEDYSKFTYSDCQPWHFFCKDYCQVSGLCQRLPGGE